MADDVREVEQGDGWSVASLEGLGDGLGFRKVRKQLGVSAFGVNAIVLPPGYQSRTLWHDQQEELYVVLEGTFEIVLDGDAKRLGPGGMARVDAGVKRSLKNVGDSDATYLCVGGKDGYVGRDGQLADGGATRVHQS